MAPKRPQRVKPDSGSSGAVARGSGSSGSGDDDVGRRVAAWSSQYHLPDEGLPASGNELKGLYKPPRDDVKGVAIALSVIASWAALFFHGCWQVRLSDAPDGSARRSALLDIVGTFLALEFVNTGLFITTHDAMHGTICFSNRRLNDLLGRIAISLYAWFDYDMLHRKHWEHHNHTGQQGKDPDFHHGNPHVLAWFVRFMATYSTPLQFAKIMLAASLLQAAGVPYANLCVYMAGAPILAAVRLFYFGTYLPHCPSEPSEPMPWQKSASADIPSWLSFLQCYHFGYHWEHHRWPYAPWWELPKARAITRAAHMTQAEQQQQQRSEQQVQVQRAAQAQPQGAAVAAAN